MIDKSKFQTISTLMCVFPKYILLKYDGRKIQNEKSFLEDYYIRADEVEVIKEEERKWMNNSCDNCWFFKNGDCKKMNIQSFSGSVQLGKGFYCSCWSKR